MKEYGFWYVMISVCFGMIVSDVGIFLFILFYWILLVWFKVNIVFNFGLLMKMCFLFRLYVIYVGDKRFGSLIVFVILFCLFRIFMYGFGLIDCKLYDIMNFLLL